MRSHEEGGGTSRARTVDDLLRQGRSILRSSAIEIDSREAAYLLAHILKVTEVRVRAFGERAVDDEQAVHYLDLLRRRASGEPSAYLLGRREFYGRDFLVDPRVLVPRPETEHLIEVVLDLDLGFVLPRTPRILDIGTGSGCIAVTLALEMSARGVTPTVVATDLSPGALDVARTNARRLGANVSLIQADLATPLRLDAFDVVASNPPYVSRDDQGSLSPEVTEHEPHLALFAPQRGTEILDRLLRGARSMRSGAYLVMEIGHDQGAWIEDRAERLEHLEVLGLVRDLGDRTRTAILWIR